METFGKPRNKDKPSNINKYSSICDDQTIIQETEDKLQRSLHQLYLLCENYNMKISTKKTKMMAFLGAYPVRTKITVHNHLIEQLSHFNTWDVIRATNQTTI